MPWSSGYGKRLVFRRSWVRIPVVVCRKDKKEPRDGPFFLKSIHISESCFASYHCSCLRRYSFKEGISLETKLEIGLRERISFANKNTIWSRKIAKLRRCTYYHLAVVSSSRYKSSNVGTCIHSCTSMD